MLNFESLRSISSRIFNFVCAPHTKIAVRPSDKVFSMKIVRRGILDAVGEKEVINV